nr:hypothetical protein BaRGS_015407 [Batillaria attramentaria]
MTSFWGYLTEGTFLLVLAFWWMVNTCYDIIQSKHEKSEVRSKHSYTWPGTNIPVEIFYKLFISAFGFFGQLVYGRGEFYDSDGNFDNMTELMYMSVGSNYAAAATGFFWYALALYNRSHDFAERPVSMMTLTFPGYLLLSISVVFVLEPLWLSGSVTQLVRAFFLQTYATWCWQSGFILHAHSGFPGSAENPAWDQTDHRNTAFTAAFFGLHLCLNLVFAALTYSLTAYFMRMRFGIQVDNSEDLTSGYGYKPLSTDYSSSEVDGANAKRLSAFVA